MCLEVQCFVKHVRCQGTHAGPAHGIGDIGSCPEGRQTRAKKRNVNSFLNHDAIIINHLNALIMHV